MSDNDTQPEEAQSTCNAPNIAFTRATTGVQTRCRQMAMAIQDHDFERMADLAPAATNLWLTARAACRRLTAHTKEPSPYTDAARRHLEQGYIDLLDLFARATTTIAVPRMRRVLAELRETLVAAMAQPLLTPEISPVGDDQ